MTHRTFSLLTFIVLIASQPSVLAAIPSPSLPERPQAIESPIDRENDERVIIVFDNMNNAIAKLQELTNNNVKIKRTYNIIPAISAHVPQEIRELLAKSPSIKGIYDDVKVMIQLDESVPQIRADQTYASGDAGDGVRVCVVDTGVDGTHSSLPPLIAQYDFSNNDNNAADDNGHGTHVAGIIASQHATFKGVAPNVQLMASKVLDRGGSGDTSDVIAGVEWCVNNGADVINMSLGAGNYSGTCDSEPLAAAANAAVAAGVTVLAASGNNGWDSRILSPSCGSSVIAVGAVDKDDSLGSYSNGGVELDITAPGTSIESTLPGNRFGKLTGTSMATPHAAGVAAIIIQQNPFFTPAEVRTILRDSSIDLGDTGFDMAFGYGRVDAVNAVIDANGGITPPPPPPPPSDTIILFSDDFENSLTQWNNTGWKTASASEQNVPQNGSSNQVAHIDRCVDCRLTMKNGVDLSGVVNATLSLWRYVDRSTDHNEGLVIEGRGDGAWMQLAEWTNGSGDDDTWHKEEINLSQFIGSNNVQLRFIGSVSSGIEDVDIDDVAITATQTTSSDPIAHAGTDKTYADSDASGDETVQLNGSASQDPDGSIVSYLWTMGATQIGTEMNPSISLPIGEHTITLTVTDNDGNTDDDTVTITVAENQAPVANAESVTAYDADDDGFETITLDGSTSYDPDGTIVQYSWTIDDVEISTDKSHNYDFPVGETNVMLAVTDDGGAESSKQISITVTPYQNQAPVANAGSNQTLQDSDNSGEEDITLDGSASYDTDGTITSYKWMDGFTILSTGSTVMTSLSVGTHSISLTVMDDKGETDTDDVTITVEENQSPVAVADDASVNDSDKNGAESVTLDASDSYDPDGTIVRYSWSDGKIEICDTETCTWNFAVGTHAIQLTVFDNGGSFASKNVTIIVNPYENTPPVADAGDDIVITDDDTDGFEIVRLDGSNSFDPNGTIATYTWNDGTQNIASTPIVDVELPTGTHTFTLTVTDDEGAQSQDSVSVIVNAGQILPTNFSDSFESGLSSWKFSGDSGWSTNNADEEIPGTNRNNTIAHVNKCKENGGCIMELKNPVNTSGGNPTLSFWRYIDKGIDRDEFLAVDAFNGTSWVRIFDWTNKNGDDNTWYNESVTLGSAFSHPTFSIRFHFAASAFFEFAEIDDVEISVQ